MGDDIGLGLPSMAVCFDFCSTNVVQLSNQNPYFYRFRCHHPLKTQLSFSQTISEWNYQFWFTVTQEDEKKKSDGGAGEGGAGEDPSKKKYEKMPKWQKWSYIISVIMMGGLTIANGVLFCKFKTLLQVILKKSLNSS